MSLKRKIMFLALALCIAFSVILTGTLTAASIEHDCTETECSACLSIEASEIFLKSLKTAFVGFYLAVFLMFIIQILPNLISFNIYHLSPVMLKVRNNS